MGRVAPKPSFDVGLSWLRFDPDVPHLWDFLLGREGPLAVKTFPSCAHLDPGRLGEGALLADSIPFSCQPHLFPQDHILSLHIPRREEGSPIKGHS